MCAKGMRRMESGQASSKTINWYVYWWLLWCLAALAGFLPCMAAQSATLVASKARCMYRSEFSCIQMYFFNLGCLKQWVEQIMTPNDPQGFCESECYASALGILTLVYFGRRGVPKYDWETPSPQSSWPIHQTGTVVVPIRKFGLCFWFFYTSVQRILCERSGTLRSAQSKRNWFNLSVKKKWRFEQRPFKPCSLWTGTKVVSRDKIVLV